jgi:hydroxymethylpyrimidine/phosphomethylpyrimidine kinase
MPPIAIKIGMLATANIVSAVADILADLQHPRCYIVEDPVLRSSSGTALLDGEGIRILCDRLLPLASVVTPNRAEAAVLTGLPIEDVEAMARALRQLGSAACVITGGDTARSGDRDALWNEDREYAEDILVYSAGGMEFVETLSAPRIRSSNTHGTGCAFSTAIACALAHGQNIAQAVTSAKAFVRLAIERAPSLGKGKGPMGLDKAGRD